jgi:hypothetical protein
MIYSLLLQFHRPRVAFMELDPEWHGLCLRNKQAGKMNMIHAMKLTFAVLKSNPSIIGKLDTEHLLKIAEAAVDCRHVNPSTRHDHENLRVIRLTQARAFNVSCSQRNDESVEGYEELKG